MTRTSSIPVHGVAPGDTREPSDPPAGARPGHSAWRAAWPLILLFLISLPAVTTRIYASDEVQYFVFLRSAWFDHDVSFDNDYRSFYEHGTAASEGFYKTHLEGTTETGRRVNFGTIGCALLWAPFYGVADVLVRAGALAGPPDGFSHPYIAAVCYGSAFYALAALLLSVAAARQLVDGRSGMRAAAVSSVAVLAGTPLVFYSYVAPVFAHACSAFAVALFVFAWLRVRPNWRARGLVALGASAALMTMVREQDIFFIVGPAIDFAITLGGGRRAAGTDGEHAGPSRLRLLADACAGGVAFAIAWAPQAFTYLALNGRFGPSRLVSRKMTWSSPHALQVLVSPEYGLFFWTPLALVAVAGLLLLAAGRLRVTDRRVIACMLAMFAAQVYITGSVESWTVAGAFGQRRFVGLTILLVIGLAAILARARSGAARALVPVLLAACTWWNVALMVQFATGLMDRQRLTLGSNVYNAFVVVPRELPRIVVRYAFDRKSFYAAPPGGARNH